MSFIDGLKDKAEEFGEKAKDGLAAAKDKASGLVEDVKDRFDGNDTPADHPGMPAGEAADGIGDAVSAGANPAPADAGSAADSVAETADSGQDKYDEVLDAAQDKADALQADPDLRADPDLQADPDAYRA